MPTPLITVVDDDPTFIEMMREILADEGYQVMTSLGGSDVLATIHKPRPDLIILDIRMEKPDAGWTLLSTLRLGTDTSDIPVIVSSADGQFPAAKAAQLAAHGVEVLEKPFNIEELIDKIKRILGPSERTS
jgi:CheY-like chemotaxis protein